MVILTVFLFVVGAVTLMVFYRQLGEMMTQTGILNIQAQQAAADSVVSAKSVERQLAIADMQAKAAQRTADAAYRSLRATIESDRPWIASNGITVKGATFEERDYFTGTESRPSGPQARRESSQPLSQPALLPRRDHPCRSRWRERAGDRTGHLPHSPWRR